MVSAVNGAVLTAAPGAQAEARLRWRDYYFLFAPLVIPYLVYQKGYSLLNSLGFVSYFGYAVLLAMMAKKLTREQLYLVFGMVVLGVQLLLRSRSGLNSCLSLIAFVVVYEELVVRIGLARALRLTAILYAINIAFMLLELISQFGFLPQLVDPEHASWSVIPPLQVGTSLYMQAQASALVGAAAMAGAVAGFSAAKTPKWRAAFLVAGLVSLSLTVINIRGTSLVSVVFAAIVIAIVKFGKRGLLTLGLVAGAVVWIVSANMEAIVQILGFRFIDPNTGFIDEAIVSTYMDLFLGVFHRWQQSPLGDQLLGQRWGADMVGEFGFGTMLYTEGLLVLTIYLSFVLYECWRAFRFPRERKPQTAIVYWNVFALVLYLASLTHYTNALNIGVANLMGLHIALNIALFREARERPAGDSGRKRPALQSSFAPGAVTFGEARSS